jgi:hypothetical protein
MIVPFRDLTDSSKPADGIGGSHCPRLPFAIFPKDIKAA